MVQQKIIRLVDDLNGSEADETVRFAVGAKAYEIDLSEANATKMRDNLAPWIKVARRVGGRSSRN